MYAFSHGIILALGLILPLGVQNLFVFTQGAMQPRYLLTLPVVITAALCDTALILLAVQGVSLLLLTFSFLKLMLVSVGCLFLLYMGILTWRSPSPQQTATAQLLSLKQQIFFALTTSLLNPHAVLDTIGVIGTSSIHYQGEEKWYFTIACILVSWLWFLSLAAAGHVLGSKQWFEKISKFINKISALFIWSSALYMLYISL